MPTRIEDFTIGWICAIPTEYTAACELLDHVYETQDAPRVQGPSIYTFGRIHEHNIAITCLPYGRYGLTSAAITAERMRASFPALQFGLMVGIGGGAPSQKHDIRLGDVVVSSPTPGQGGVIQYDYGKAIQGHEFEETGHLASPPEVFLNGLSKIKALHNRKRHQIEKKLDEWLKRKPDLRMEYDRPDSQLDILYKASFVHSEQQPCACQKNEQPSVEKNCESLVVTREVRESGNHGVRIHYGLIASANTLMKDATARDALVKKYDVLCFEMEAAGLMNILPCLIIRGVCDYSDSHKNDRWHGYAAAVAAIYAKELLAVIPGQQIGSSTSTANISQRL